MELTARQLQIVQGIVAGMQDKEIASALGLSIKTVKNYILFIHNKIKSKRKNRVLIAVWALRNGICV